MMRSLYSGVSGLQNHQIRMDVLGNNISNINTTGFKKGRVNFQDMLSQTLSGAAKPTDEVGGVNPKQVGLGMVIAGFVPNPLGQVVEYWPTFTEVMITVGVYAIGIFLLTIFYKIALSVKAGSPGVDH